MKCMSKYRIVVDKWGYHWPQVRNFFVWVNLENRNSFNPYKKKLSEKGARVSIKKHMNKTKTKSWVIPIQIAEK